MKYLIVYFLLPLFLTAQTQYERLWGTYLSNSDYNFIFGDVAVDNDGNIWVVGRSGETNIITVDAMQADYAGGNDGLIMKFNPDGELLYASYFGGSSFDLLYAIQKDLEGNLIILGETESDDIITTPAAFQPEFGGFTDFFILKIDSNGQRIWSTYFGGEANDVATIKSRNVSIDEANNYFIGFTVNSDGMATEEAYQEERLISNNLLTKFDSEGIRIWATYYGTVGTLGGLAYQNGQVFMATSYTTVEGTEPDIDTFGDTCPNAVGDRDVFLVSFDAESGERNWGRCFGGIYGYELIGNKALAVNTTALYLTGLSDNQTNLTTEGVYNPDLVEAFEAANFLAKFNLNGDLQWATYLGEDSFDSNLTHYSTVHFNDNYVYVAGDTSKIKMITTENAYQSQLNTEAGDYGYIDAYFMKFNQEGELQYGTYYGGEQVDDLYVNLAFDGEDLYLGFNTISYTGIATENAWITDYSGGSGVGALVKFRQTNLATTEVSNEFWQITLFPNPAKEVLNIKISGNFPAELSATIYNSIGQKIKNITLNNGEAVLSTQEFSPGVYFLQMRHQGRIYHKKFLVE